MTTEKLKEVLGAVVTAIINAYELGMTDYEITDALVEQMVDDLPEIENEMNNIVNLLTEDNAEEA